MRERDAKCHTLTYVSKRSASRTICRAPRRPTHRKLEYQSNWTGYFARFNTISNVTPAGVRGFVNFISSAVMDVTIRR